MNRKQLQEWLEQFPEDTVISVVVEEDNPRAYGVRTIDLEVFNGGDNQYLYADYSLYGKPHKHNSSSSDRQLILGGY